MSFLLKFIFMLFSKVHDGFWAITGHDLNFQQEYCDIKWRVYDTCSTKRRYIEYCVEKGMDIFSSQFFKNGTEELVMLGLPFYSNFSDNNVAPMIKALVGRCNFNLIALDSAIHTGVANPLDYPKTMLQVYKDSQRYAAVLNEALRGGKFSPHHLTGLGFSMGAQQVGQVCRLLQKKCGYILAVDPAGPLYLPRELPLLQNFPHLHLVSRADACHVVFVECNRWLMGSGFRTAHENIQVNNGMFQPTCFFGNLLCSHVFCNKLVINAISSPKPCVVRTSNNPRSIFTIDNNTDDSAIQIPLSKQIDTCDSQESKVFYLKTSQVQPLC